MKNRTAFFIIILLVVLIALFVITIFIAAGVFDKYDVEIPNVPMIGNSQDLYTQFPIRRGNIEVFADLKGTVVYSNGVLNIDVGESETAEILCQVGDETAAGETILYTSDTDTYKSPTDGRVLAIKDGIITILDYNASYITVNIPSQYQSDMNYRNPITATFHDESVELAIHSISPGINQDCFEVSLRNPFRALDGSIVDIHISFETKENVIYVNKRWIHEDSDGKTYLNILDDDGTVSKTYVDIGVENGTDAEIRNSDELEGKIAVVSKGELMLQGD